MSTNFLSREEAELILKPFLKPIFGCIENAWGDFLSIDPEKAQKLEIRTRAGLIRDFTVDYIKRLALSHEEMVFGAKEGHLLIGQKLLLQFKKLTDGLSVSNYQTTRRKQFDAQLPLEGIPDATRLTAGYIPDDLWMKPRELYVVCHCGKVQEWHLRVHLIDNVQRTVEYLRLPFKRENTSGVVPNNDTKKKRIRRKADVIKIGIKKNE